MHGAHSLDSHHIQQEANHQGHGDPNRRVDIGIPVLHDRRHSRILGTHQHDTGEEVRPTHGKAQGGVDITAREFKHGAPDGQPGGNLGDTQITGPDEQDAPEDIAQQQRQGPGFAQTAADSHEEARPDGAADLHQLDVSGLEATLGLAELLPFRRREPSFVEVALVREGFFRHGRALFDLFDVAFAVHLLFGGGEWMSQREGGE